MVSQFLRPKTLAEAARALAGAGEDGTLVAGGTAVVLMLREGLIAPSQLISLDAVTDPDYRGLGRTGQTVRIGGGQTISQVAASPLVRDLLPSLAHACAQVGNPRVRNRATLAGNLAEADYGSDPPAVLVCLGAYCRTISPRGTRTIAVRDLLTGYYETALAPDEIIVEVHVPVPAPGTGLSYVKYVSRSSEDRPCVGVAASIRTAGGVPEYTVVVGAVAGVPQVCADLLARTRGRPPGPDTYAELAAGYAARIRPLADARGSAWYRARMIEVFVRRALRHAAEPS